MVLEKNVYTAVISVIGVLRVNVCVRLKKY